jgi:UDP:flavonoid glycosyltransferase YjiC (YdhE family)
MGRDVIAELQIRPADLVVVDCLLWGPMEALAAAKIPYAVLEHVFDEYFTRKWLRGPMGIAIALKRFRAKRILDQAAVRLVASLPQLNPAASKPLPANVRYTGPVVTGSPANAQFPTVLVSLSTTNLPGLAEVMQNVLDALGTLDVHGIVTTGPALDASALRPPPNAELHQFIAHGEVLPRVNLVVGHGGHATTMAALAHDVPLIVLPLHPMLDQAMVGGAVEAAGAGRLLAKKANPAQIAEAMTDLLADGPHHSAAANLGSAIRDAKGAATAADVIESLVNQDAKR